MRHISTAVVFVGFLFAVEAGVVRGADPTAPSKPGVDRESVAAASGELERVPTIVKIEYYLEKIQPPNLVVTAYGKVPTGGWTQVQLIRRVYLKPPADGIWEYDLLALRPTGPVTQVETAVKASNRWDEYDQLIKGVRVYGIGRGAKELRF